MTKVKVQLVSVQARDTEDIFGDEFYLVGALAAGAIRKPILTTPISIQSGETKTFKPGQTILFEGVVPKGQTIRGGLKAYDEDLAKDWSKYNDALKKIDNAVSTISQNAEAEAIILQAIEALGFFASLDKDDFLGSTNLEISPVGPNLEEVSWRIKRSDFPLWSDWDYSVRYRITRS
ncbi:hypothetical protein IQ276_022350 [Desmonostoc muscorum LEGE 12446]|uniref:Uncharacterized protein n=1 Tax=Desmonostoc muscorum LEGE 12446 TaxID=1828758 RepID=A0A8J6ZMB8_DESMC|nr:hypothetical protein [Desmonostoc muscorum]MCF2149121.1 hypothetical protein [Desmonostoc muscorum LEGE 12446]